MPMLALQIPTSAHAAQASASVRPVDRLRRSRFRLIALASFGVLVGPFTIAILMALPVLLLWIGIQFQNVFILTVAVATIVLHAIAVRALLRAKRSGLRAEYTVTLGRSEAPDLYALVERLAQRIEAPTVHDVVIGSTVNASLTQTPIVFGLAGHRNVLTLGLPLLQTLTRDQLAGVIAHELSHLRADDGQLYALVSGVRAQWLRIRNGCDSGTFVGQSALRRFADAYLATLDRTATGVMRASEFAADQVAASVVGSETICLALARAAQAQETLSQLWDNYWLRNVREAYPAQGPWTAFSKALRNVSPALTGTLGHEVHTICHPRLADRLARLDPSFHLVAHDPCAGTPPAEDLLGAQRTHVRRSLNNQWWSEHKDRWCTFHRGVADQFNRLNLLDAAARDHALTLETALERTARAEYLLGAPEAISRAAWCVAAFPTAAHAHERLGTLLLQAGDHRGSAHIRKAVEIRSTTATT